jgi:hypothetical protein
MFAQVFYRRGGKMFRSGISLLAASNGSVALSSRQRNLTPMQIPARTPVRVQPSIGMGSEHLHLY